MCVVEELTLVFIRVLIYSDANYFEGFILWHDNKVWDFFLESSFYWPRKYRPSVEEQDEDWTPGSEDKPADAADVEKVCFSIPVLHQSLDLPFCCLDVK